MPGLRTGLWGDEVASGAQGLGQAYAQYLQNMRQLEQNQFNQQMAQEELNLQRQKYNTDTVLQNRQLSNQDRSFGLEQEKFNNQKPLVNAQVREAKAGTREKRVRTRAGQTSLDNSTRVADLIAGGKVANELSQMDWDPYSGEQNYQTSYRLMQPAIKQAGFTPEELDTLKPSDLAKMFAALAAGASNQVVPQNLNDSKGYGPGTTLIGPTGVNQGSTPSWRNDGKSITEETTGTTIPIPNLSLGSGMNKGDASLVSAASRMASMPTWQMDDFTERYPQGKDFASNMIASANQVVMPKTSAPVNTVPVIPNLPTSNGLIVPGTQPQFGPQTQQAPDETSGLRKVYYKQRLPNGATRIVRVVDSPESRIEMPRQGFELVAPQVLQ